MAQLEVTLVSAFVVGLMGGVHCIGMCGGLVSAFGLALSPAGEKSNNAALGYVLLYNLGRVSSYALAGALAGGLGGAAAALGVVRHVQLWLLLGSGLMMCALGLYLAGWWLGLTRIERLGGHVWRRLEPLGRRFVPVRRPRHAYFLGLIWGWLPCGLVYTVLIWSLTAGSALRGAGLMLSFGLGTLPLLMLLGMSASGLGRYIQHPWVRRGAGTAVAVYGLYMIGYSLWTLLRP